MEKGGKTTILQEERQNSIKQYIINFSTISPLPQTEHTTRLTIHETHAQFAFEALCQVANRRPG